MAHSEPGLLPHDSHPPRMDAIGPSVWRDLIVVAAVTVATFVISSALELNERVIAFTRPFEAYQVDELPTTFVAMIMALAWFSWRRSRQTVEQAILRLAAQRELAEALTENRRLSQRYLQVQERNQGRRCQYSRGRRRSARCRSQCASHY